MIITRKEIDNLPKNIKNVFGDHCITTEKKSPAGLIYQTDEIHGVDLIFPWEEIGFILSKVMLQKLSPDEVNFYFETSKLLYTGNDNSTEMINDEKFSRYIKNGKIRYGLSTQLNMMLSKIRDHLTTRSDSRRFYIPIYETVHMQYINEPECNVPSILGIQFLNYKTNDSQFCTDMTVFSRSMDMHFIMFDIAYFLNFAQWLFKPASMEKMNVIFLISNLYKE